MMRSLLLAIAAVVPVLGQGIADPAPDRARLAALVLENKNRQAVELGETLRKRNPDDVELYRLLAEARMNLGQWKAAEENLQWMLDLRLGKATSEGFLTLSRFRERTGDRSGALEALAAAEVRLAPGDEQGRQSIQARRARLSAASLPVRMQSGKPMPR